MTEENIEIIKENKKYTLHNCVTKCNCDDCLLIDTIDHLHASIDTLADQYKNQGRIDVAQEIRRLGE